MNYWFFADRFGWTPDQVDDLPVFVFDRLPEISTIVEEIRNRRR